MALRLSQKKLSQLLAVSVLGLFFWLAVTLLDQKTNLLKLDLPANQISSETTEELVPKKTAIPDVSLQDFKRNSQSDDSLHWELEGKTINLFTDDDLIEIQQPNIKSYQDPTNPLLIKALQAIVLFKDNDIKEADLKKSVSIKNNTCTITTEQAKFNKNKNIITSEQPVTINKEGSIINGIGLKANLTSEVFELSSDVDSTLKDKEKEKNFHITSNQLSFDNANSTFIYIGNVIATDGAYIIKADKLTGNMNSAQELEQLFANGAVTITKGTNLRTYSEKADFDFAKNLIVLREDPELEKDKSILSADVIYYNTITEQSTAEGEVDIKVLEDAKEP